MALKKITWETDDFEESRDVVADIDPSLVVTLLEDQDMGGYNRWVYVLVNDSDGHDVVARVVDALDLDPDQDVETVDPLTIPGYNDEPLETVAQLLNALDARGDKVDAAAAQLIRMLAAEAPDLLDIENAELPRSYDDDDKDYGVIDAIDREEELRRDAIARGASDDVDIIIPE